MAVSVARFALLALGLGFAGGGLWMLWLLRRPNRSRIHPLLADVLEHWDIVADGLHNSNTDMIRWRGELLLVHAASPWHLGSSKCRLVVRRSAEGQTWQTLCELRVPGKDIRDPKLIVIGGRLFLYALTNDGVMARPSCTVLATSEDGSHWSDFEPVGPTGWLFWRPKSPDAGKTFYVPAYWHEHGRSILLRSEDGRSWQQVSEIHRGEGNDETAIEFLPDGRMLATARLEVTPDRLLGNEEAATLLAVSSPPYTEWEKVRSQVTRLDGPVLFPHAGRVFAVARYQAGPRRRFTRLGGLFSRKRTALFEVREQELVYLSDLPSSGDTSYPGVVLRGGDLLTDYYTNDVKRDVPWILGMFQRSDIRMARLPLDRLVALADAIRT